MAARSTMYVHMPDATQREVNVGLDKKLMYTWVPGKE
jgi:hypothetical protein